MFFIFIGFLIYNYTSVTASMRDEVYKDSVKTYKLFFKREYEKKREIGIISATLLAQNEYVVSSLMDADRNYVIKGLKKVVDIFKAETSLKNIKIHIHDEDVHSFLRIWNPKKYGDDLSKFRKTILKVKETKSNLVAVELGRAGLILRGLAPVIVQNTYIGSVEFMQGFNSIAKNGKKEDMDVLIVMKQKYLDIATGLNNSKKIDDYVLPI